MPSFYLKHWNAPNAEDSQPATFAKFRKNWKSVTKNSGKVGDKSMAKKINHGKKDLVTAEDFDPKNVKERITIWLDEEVLDGFRSRAKAEGSKYQSLVNRALREALKRPSLVARVERLEKKLGVS
jgi:uncharacterized protein (DUF4415 family)